MSYQKKVWCCASAAFTALLLSACSKMPEANDEVMAEESQRAETTDSTAAPVANQHILHARLYVKDQIHTAAIGSSNQLQAAFHLQTPVQVEGSGLDTRFIDVYDEDQVQGQLVATGQTDFKSDPALTEHYQMQASWPALAPVTSGRFRVSAPEPSSIGEGYSVKVELEVPVSGDKKAQISSEGTVIDTGITHAQPLACSTDNGQDVCKLTYTIDAVPTTARDEAGKLLLDSAKTLYASQGKIDKDGGLIMYGSLVPVYGATSAIEDGHLVIRSAQQYSLKFKDADMAQQLELVVWTNAPGDTWQPEQLPPLTF